jgi:hypothetical protein
MIQTVNKLRTGINKLIFEKFVLSVDHADQRKQNSLLLFMSNMSEFVSKQSNQIKHSIEAYYEARNGIKEYLAKQ